jgi:hypothetical protein
VAANDRELSRLDEQAERDRPWRESPEPMFELAFHFVCE